MLRVLFPLAALLLVPAFSLPIRAEDIQSKQPAAVAVDPANAATPDVAAAKPWPKRVLLITSPDIPECANELAKLNAADGVFERMRKTGWKIGPEPAGHVQIVDISQPLDAEIAEIVASHPPTNAPTVLCIDHGVVDRTFQHGCTTPLDPWTFKWLLTGNDERPVPFDPEPVTVATTGNYPLRGNHWSVEGNWNASFEFIVQHMRTTHAAEIKSDWSIESWSREELLSLHDDLHEREAGFRGRYSGGAVAQSRNAGSSGYRKPGNAGR